MQTVEYEAATINCAGKDYLIYFFYLWSEDQQCWLWDEDKLSYSEAMERYPQTKFTWVLINE